MEYNSAMDNSSKEYPDLYVTEGPLKGHVFTVAEGGARLGRSSTCEISIADPALSRNNSLFERRDGAIWVTDLASVNGTYVNGEKLGSEPVRLNVGDEVAAGDSAVFVGPPPDEDAASGLDLGLGRRDEPQAGGDAVPGPQRKGSPAIRFILWGIVFALFALAFALWMLVPGDPETLSDTRARSMREAREDAILNLSYEKVEADTSGIYRYMLEFSGSTGELSVKIDSVPRDERHVSESKKLDSQARSELERMLSSPSLYALESEYSGLAPRPGELKSFSMKVVRTGRVFSTSIVDTVEPQAFKDARNALETFAQNELGIWAIQYPIEKLVELSRQSESSADEKYAERDVNYGNLYAALEEYGKAIFYLQTVEPKPQGFLSLLDKQQRAAAELDSRYAERSFLVDRAVKMGDWQTARDELRILCEMAGGERRASAEAKLMDVENRIKKGGGR